jgi:hypothetical protein
LIKAVAYVRTETFFATDDLETAARSLIQAVDHIPAKSLGSPRGAATYGSLHMRAAVVAARMGEAGSARDHLAEAKLMADRVPEGVYYGTAFGPDSVKIHDVAVNVDLGTRRRRWNVPVLGSLRTSFRRNVGRTTSLIWLVRRWRLVVMVRLTMPCGRRV